jgi:hypothetical protein
MLFYLLDFFFSEPMPPGEHRTLPLRPKLLCQWLTHHDLALHWAGYSPVHRTWKDT